MTDVLVRDLDPGALDRLKRRASQNGRSLQGELKSILESAARPVASDPKKLAASLRKRLAGRSHSDSSLLVEEDRTR